MFDTFSGNPHIVAAIRQMLAEDRLPHTLLFAGVEGVGKATLARLAAAALNCHRGGPDPCGECSACRRILEADLSLPHYRALLEERAKMSPDKRRDNPLVLGLHPEFLTFPPDGPLAQISIEQVRRMKEYAQFGPSEGRRRVFLVDRADRIDAAAANSLLKLLEEPPPYLTVVLTAENAYDLLPTIRSRSVPFFFAPLDSTAMGRFLATRSDVAPPDRPLRIAFAQGSPGRALMLDVAAYDKRRQAILALLRAALGGRGGFGELIRHTEVIGRSKQERLEAQLDALYGLLRDVMRLHYQGKAARLVNEDLRKELADLASRVSFEWLENALEQIDSLDSLVRRNIQKQIALEALAVSLRPGPPARP